MCNVLDKIAAHRLFSIEIVLEFTSSHAHCTYTALLKKINLRGIPLNEHYRELFNNRSKNHSLSGAPRTFAYANSAVYVK